MTKQQRMGPLELKRLRNEALLNMTLVSSSVHLKTDVAGMELFADRLPPRQAVKEINKFMLRFQSNKFDWSVWLANFWEQGDERLIQPKVIHVPATATSDIDAIVRENILIDADDSIETEGFSRDDWRGFAYVITLNDQIDFEAEEDRLIKIFEDKDIWNQTLRHLVIEQKANRNANHEELQQAMEQLEQVADKYISTKG